MDKKPNPRRKFLKTAAMTSGISSIGVLPVNSAPSPDSRLVCKLPREVWVAGISQEAVFAGTAEEMIDRIFILMEKVLVNQPDIICLPELFHTANITKNYSLSEKIAISNNVLDKMAAFAKKYHCYLVVAVNTEEKDKVFNSAVLLDRNGINVGEYRKIHLTEDEINNGLTPGPLDPPVFQTDLGKVGIQICFDVLWEDGWKKLKDKGAELVFWPSAYGGGQSLQAKSLQHRYVVATSTRKGSAKLWDITGKEVAKTGFWEKNYYCAPVNLEKAFLHTWPFVKYFDEIKEKYGRKIRITNFHEEEWSVIESLSPDILIADILKEYNLKTYDQHRYDAEMAQNKARNS
ncbi:carbon-nitrogen hydrolase family protein [Cyclobacterium sp. 1_MG-2023]|uniref:carbon-nitrogen hydrolase family protein n=1 Tax=Cyclobacterium sp. 1_MG-2023 TaxID=3062681 RepID=UPI0026E46C40|nr:carbon-nitrogen hydrolase family protein [Cyclobacterium sp. 1_MG-2023]MDO6439239.1 carbon-nitrogen hydrolase family protein [Cyclobacterium sp. 1_MG-2023]